MDIEELRSRVNSRPWFHRIDLGHGIVTPGNDDSPRKLKLIGMPEDLTGKSVLDIGAWDGFFSFEAERRGAARVVAADHFVWIKRPRRTELQTRKATKEGFDLAHEALNSKVEGVVVPVEEMSPESLGTFDLVLFLGVLYHSQNPLQYLRIVRSLCRGQLILETHIDALDYPRPAMVFYPGGTLNNDPTNFWGPNPQAVADMLREVGFGRIENHALWDAGYQGATKATRTVMHAFV